MRTQQRHGPPTRLTARRRAILDIVASSRAHPDARGVFREAQALWPGISLATVYRALGWLTDIGLCVEIQGEGPARFDTNAAPHDHVVCRRCGRMVDVDLPLAAIRQAAREQSGFASVRAGQVLLQGTCADCASKASGRGGAGRSGS